MDILKNLFGDPVPTGVTLVLLTVLLVIVLLVVVWIFRKFVGSPSIKSVRGRQPRLAVTDAANLDDKRRLVLVRRDNVEHLVMIGGATDVLLESNIARSTPQMSENSDPKDIEPLNQPVENEIAPVVGMGAIAATAATTADTQTDNQEANQELETTFENESKVDLSNPLDSEVTTVEEIKEAALSDISSTLDDSKTPIETNVSATEIGNVEEIESEALASLENAMGSELEDDTPNLSDGTTASTPTIETTPTKPELGSQAVSPVSQEAPLASKDASHASKETDADNMEDEMQKLLDELSGEKT